MKLHPYTGDTVGIHGKVQEILNMSPNGNSPRSPRTLTVTVMSKRKPPEIDVTIHSLLLSLEFCQAT